MKNCLHSCKVGDRIIYSNEEYSRCFIVSRSWNNGSLLATDMNGIELSFYSIDINNGSYWVSKIIKVK